MEEQRFDQLARTLAGGASRRALLKGLAGAVTGGVIGLTRQRHAAAATPCTSARQCPSRFCVDGFCCDRPCTGQCEACNVAGQEGACTPVAGRPVGKRAACPGAGPCQATCDGQNRNTCAFPGNQVTCGAPACADGLQTTYACGGNGTCVPATIRCGLFVCNSARTACLTDCAANFDCVGEAFCGLDGVCRGDRGIGEPCSSADQCQHGHCVDGVCCNQACVGDCEACNLPGNAGFCTREADGAVCGDGTCCDGDCVDLQRDLEHCGACDNACPLVPPGPCADDPICRTGQCTFIPQSQDTPCRSADGPCDIAEVCDGESIDCPPDRFRLGTLECRPGRCVDGVASLPATCTGTSAACPPGANESCAPYVCNTEGTACLVTCANDAHCVAGHHCDGIICTPNGDLGATCDEDSDCVSGRCNSTSGFCCAATCNPDVPCTGPDFTCGCPTDCSELDDECIVGVCNPATGMCEERPDSNNPDCDEENPCSFCLVCQTCRGGTCIDLDEGSPCGVGNECGIVGGECRSGFCIGTIVACPTCQTCRGGQCEPVADETACDDGDGDACTVGMCQGGVCVSSDVTCPICQTCSGGACVPVDDGIRCDLFSHIICCGGECVDTHRDPEHCDRCGRSCGADGACVQQDCCPVDQVCTTDPGDIPFRCCRAGELCVGGPTAACCAPNGVSCDTSDDCCLFSRNCPPGGGVCGGPGAFCVDDDGCNSGRCNDEACA